MAKKFIWLSDDCYPRKGPKLKKGETYSTDEFDDPKRKVKGEDVVAEWVRQKLARYTSDEKPKEKKSNGGK